MVGGLLEHYVLLEQALPISNCERIEQIFDAYRARYAETALDFPLDEFRDTFLNAEPATAEIR